MRHKHYRRARGGNMFASVSKGALVLCLGVGAFFGVIELKQRFQLTAVDEDYCFVNAPIPARALVIIDVTDPMIATQDRMVRGVLDDVMAELPDGGLLMTSSITGETPDQLNPHVETCKPVREDNRSRRYYEDNFVAEVNATIDRLGRQPEALASPILETLLAAVGDPQLAVDRTPVGVVILSDYMQHSELASFYTGAPYLRDPVGQPLTGVTVEMRVLRNDDYSHLQAASAAVFAAWLTKAGATVVYTPPAWMSVRTPTYLVELADAD